MKRDFKNLITSTDFKVLYENNKIEDNTLFKDFPINESMDFSNNTGFSQSLIGRAINRLFSLAATQKEIIILKNLKEKISETYLKAITLTFSTQNIIVEKKEKVNKADLDEEKMFELLKKWAIEKAYKIVHENEPKNYNEVYDVYDFDDEQIELWKQAMEIEIEILDSEIIKGDDIIIYNVDKDNAVDSLNSVEQHIEEWEFEDPQKVKLGVLAATMQPEIDDDATSDEKKTALIALQAKIIQNMNINKSQDKKEIQKALPTHTQDYDIWYPVYEAKVIKKNMEKELAKKQKAKEDTTDIDTKLDDVTTLMNDKKYQEVINKYGAEYTNYNESKSYNNYEKIFEDSNSNPVLRKKADQLYRNIVAKVTDEQKSKYAKIFNLSDLISNLPLEPGDTEETKKAVKNSGGDISNFEKTIKNIKDADEKKEVIKQNIANVNNELLKIYQLKAKYIYTDPNESITVDALKHLNFTISPTDRKKLENKWEQLISTVKAQYMIFFSDNGIFPKILDPIALVQSDKKLRGESGLDEHNLSKVSSSGEKVETIDVLKKLHMKSGGINKIGLLKFEILNKEIVLLVKPIQIKINDENKIIFALKDIYNFGLIKKKIEEDIELDNKTIKEYISTKTKLIDDFDNNKKILNQFIFNDSSETMKKPFSFSKKTSSSSSYRYDNIFLIITNGHNDKTMTLQLFKYENGGVKFLISNQNVYEYTDNYQTPGNPNKIEDIFILLKDYDEIWEDFNLNQSFISDLKDKLKDNENLKKCFKK